jgi:hypothetical protein
MRLNLKALGLALVAALAMSAVAASAAQAANGKFRAQNNVEAVAKGAQEVGEGIDNYFEATAGEKVTCTTATYQATLKEADTTLTVTPHYAGCSKGGTGVSVTLNGCHYLFHTSGTTVDGDTPGTADVVCPSGKEIVIAGPFGICKDHIVPQTGLTGVTFTNVANGDVTVDVDITNQIHYTHEDNTFCPWTAGGTETRTDGDFVSSVLMEGFVDAGGTSAGPTSGIGTYNTGNALNIEVS